MPLHIIYVQECPTEVLIEIGSKGSRQGVHDRSGQRDGNNIMNTVTVSNSGLPTSLVYFMIIMLDVELLSDGCWPAYMVAAIFPILFMCVELSVMVMIFRMMFV